MKGSLSQEIPTVQTTLTGYPIASGTSPKPIEMALLMVFILLLYTVIAYIIKPFNGRERTAINRILPKSIFVW